MNEITNEEIELMDYLKVIWKRKWLIIIPTLICVIIAGIISFLLPKKWEIDTIILPSKMLIQTAQGGFEEVVVIDPKQIAGQINEKTYNNLIAAELNLSIREFPKLKAENLRDTKLIRVSIVESDIEKAKSILYSLFKHLKRDLDKKIDIEMKGIESKIKTKENLIKYKRITIEDRLNEIKILQNQIKSKKLDIQSKEIEKERIRQEIIALKNKLKISKDKEKDIIEAMKEVKDRISKIEEEQRKALREGKSDDAIAMLLYSNEIQNNLRYYNILNESLSNERITQENLNLEIKEKEEEIKQLDTQIEKLKTEIDTVNTQINDEKNEIKKIENEIENIRNEIELLNERKGRMDYAQLVKEPTSSINPVSPKKKLNILIAGILGLMIFTILAFFIEYIEKQKVS